VLRIEPAARSRPFGLPSLTPPRLAALRAALALPVDRVDRPRCAWHPRIQPCRRHRVGLPRDKGSCEAIFAGWPAPPVSGTPGPPSLRRWGPASGCSGCWWAKGRGGVSSHARRLRRRAWRMGAPGALRPPSNELLQRGRSGARPAHEGSGERTLSGEPDRVREPKKCGAAPHTPRKTYTHYARNVHLAKRAQVADSVAQIPFTNSAARGHEVPLWFAELLKIRGLRVYV
jgi:hypothetical protein